MPSIYELGLHGVTAVGATEIMRVPGGWIYSIQAWSDNGQQFPSTSVFVPYSEDLKDD